MHFNVSFYDALFFRNVTQSIWTLSNVNMHYNDQADSAYNQ